MTFLHLFCYANVIFLVGRVIFKLAVANSVLGFLVLLIRNENNHQSTSSISILQSDSITLLFSKIMLFIRHYQSSH